LRGLDLEIPAGMSVALCGASGASTCTFLKHCQVQVADLRLYPIVR
jgi:ABC-type phosphate/phosphonate transport system ATPase subunit